MIAARVLTTLGVLLGLSQMAGCLNGASTTTESTCGAAAPLTEDSDTGAGMADKHLALTFDDGPSVQTLELSAYLKAHGIRAAFFVNGHCFGAGNPCGNPPHATPASIFKRVIADGHIIGNHTQNHLDLTDLATYPASPAGDTGLVKALSETDALIAPYVKANRFLFRAPFGAWNARDNAVLNASPMRKYIGPVRWDIGGEIIGDQATGFAADWDCWQDNGNGVLSTKACGDRYLNEIKSRHKGVVLMHDAAFGDVGPHPLTHAPGNTLHMVKYLIPLLKAEGYTFVRLDKVPQLAKALPKFTIAGVDTDSDDPETAPAADAGDAGVAAAATDASSSQSGAAPVASASTSKVAAAPCSSPATPLAPKEYPHVDSVH